MLLVHLDKGHDLARVGAGGALKHINGLESFNPEPLEEGEQ